MKRPARSKDGNYYIKGKKYPELFGSRKQVWAGSAYKTEGCLTKKDFVMNKHGRIVSLKKFKTSKAENRLEKYGYGAEKGKFGYVKISPKTKKIRGGRPMDQNKNWNNIVNVDENGKTNKN